VAEIVVFFRYGKGIELVDGDGHVKWSHPVYALGHLEIADVRGVGHPEIVYSNSNNADGRTTFTVLDADGAIAEQIKIVTSSSEFALVERRENVARPLILLTEGRQLRLVDWQGDTLRQLDAPGCRTYGEVSAVTVKLKRDEPSYLAVRKRLHPDLLVLYVYNDAGALVYQKTEAVEGVAGVAMAAVPSDEAGVEKLLVGSTSGLNAVVDEYSATH
jgi:hypothetical protein